MRAPLAVFALACLAALPAQAGRARSQIECVTPATGREVTHTPLDWSST
jgi:hypothetical protein